VDPEASMTRRTSPVPRRGRRRAHAHRIWLKGLCAQTVRNHVVVMSSFFEYFGSIAPRKLVRHR
jgi:hypothetical protein